MKEADPSNRPNRPHISSDTQFSKNVEPKPRRQNQPRSTKIMWRNPINAASISSPEPTNKPPKRPSRPDHQHRVAAPPVKRCLNIPHSARNINRTGKWRFVHFSYFAFKNKWLRFVHLDAGAFVAALTFSRHPKRR
jgi:hypothetical protein